jgi:glycosyltransferase involved in cell wall biosynthesis
MMPPCYQVNLQTGLGGGEIYTAFFARALEALGIRTVLFADPAAAFWHALLPASAQIVCATGEALTRQLAALTGAWVVFHSLLPRAAVDMLHRAGAQATAFAHMPWHDRDPSVLHPYDLIVPVSHHVGATLRQHGLAQVHAEPLYGIADLASRRGTADESICARPVYDWDLRKVRERLLRHLYPLWWRLQPRRTFIPATGIALGIVSRLTTIKQFPKLFGIIARLLARHPAFVLEIFGSGAYASVRDLRRALAPLGDRVRWWGHQSNVAAVYAQLDYLLAGLPEKEALGLNVIEAQSCGVPVLAVGAPPFTETVAPEVTGLFFQDPRIDGGADFDRLLNRLEAAPFVIDPRGAAAHLAQFSPEAFAARVARLVRHVGRIRLGSELPAA